MCQDLGLAAHACESEARKSRLHEALGLRLISEAIGQFGFFGMVGGEAARVSLLGSGVPVAGAISSATLDRSLFILAGAVVTIAGIVGLVFAVSAVPCGSSLRRRASLGIVVLSGCRRHRHPAQMAGALGDRPCRRTHSVVRQVVAKQGTDPQSVGAADRRVLP